MIKAIIGLVGRFVAYLFLFFSVKSAGKNEQKLENAEDLLHDIHLIKTAKERLKAVDASDLALRRKLRGKYTRK